MTPEQRVLRGRLGALALHAQGRTNTSAARRAFLDRFQDEVDPNRVLDPDERERRAAFARRAHMTRLALRASQARSR
jgi:hypothetical protein